MVSDGNVMVLSNIPWYCFSIYIRVFPFYLKEYQGNEIMVDSKMLHKF